MTPHVIIMSLLASCQWEQTGCTADDFQQTVTDQGICYTFNNEAQLSDVKHTTQTGGLYHLCSQIRIKSIRILTIILCGSVVYSSCLDNLGEYF